MRFDSTLLQSYADVMAHISDSNVGAVLSLGNQDSITVHGLSKASLTSADFSFV